MNIDYTVGEVELSYKPKFKNIYKVVSSEEAALLTNSVAIILAHNHPSGNTKPSRQDMEIT